MKFYCRDWRADGKLRLCSLAACGLWVDMLSLMHDEGEPYGHLCIAGQALTTPEQIAAAVGRPLRDVRRALAELERFGVLEKSSAGCIYSRRMVRDEDVRQKRAEGGKLGGNPALLPGSKVNLSPPEELNTPHAHARALPSGLSSLGSGNHRGVGTSPPPWAQASIPEHFNTEEVRVSVVEYMAYRAKAGFKRMTDLSWKKLWKRLDECASPEDVVASFDACIGSGNQGVFPRQARKGAGGSFAEYGNFADLARRGAS